MRVGMILERDFPTTPPDIRVEKEIGSLVHAGHKVDLLSLKITSVLNYERMGDVNIFRVPIPMLCVRDWSPTRVAQHFRSPQSPWVASIAHFIRKNKIDVLHVHDLPLVWTATAAANGCDVPVIFDMHEVYPPMVKFMRGPGNGNWDPADWAATYEKECLERVSRVIVVVEESRQRLLSMGVPQQKIVVVQNTEATPRMTVKASRNTSFKIPKHKFIVTYVGTFGRIRGLELLVKAVYSLRNVLPALHLLLVGGEYNQPQLEALIRQLDLRDRVTITGWVKFEAVPRLIAASDVCVVPHIKNAFTNATIPHKLFQYMLMGKPVVVSDAAPIKRVVSECKCGKVFPSGREDFLAEAILSLAESPQERIRLGINGRRAALAEFNWQQDEKALLALYDQLAKTRY